VPLDALDVLSIASKDVLLRVSTLSPRMASRGARHTTRLFILGWKYLKIPDWSADERYG